MIDMQMKQQLLTEAESAMLTTAPLLPKLSPPCHAQRHVGGFGEACSLACIECREGFGVDVWAAIKTLSTERS
jgi:hypothetical protein